MAKLYPSKTLINSKTKEPIMLQHGNTKVGGKGSIFENTGFDGKTSSQVRKMARNSAQRLIKALKDPNPFTPV